MSVEERDNYTGHMTTGHDWNGIKELNTRVPAVLLFFLAATFLFSLVYWYFMPTWPSVDGFTRGALDFDQRNELQAQIQSANENNAGWQQQMATASFDDISLDGQLMSIVSDSGPAIFQDNCSMCHGQQGKGSLNFPNLADENWLWGGDADNIYKTLQVGINADVDGTRVAQMPAFGNTGVLDATAIGNIVVYVQSLSDEQVGSGARADELLAVNAGKAAYATNCAACHGAEGEGNTLLGAPNLADDEWIYGGDEQSIVASLTQGRAGHMPAWQGRLSDVQLRILALYVQGLGN